MADSAKACSTTNKKSVGFLHGGLSRLHTAVLEVLSRISLQFLHAPLAKKFGLYNPATHLGLDLVVLPRREWRRRVAVASAQWFAFSTSNAFDACNLRPAQTQHGVADRVEKVASSHVAMGQGVSKSSRPVLCIRRNVCLLLLAREPQLLARF